MTLNPVLAVTAPSLGGSVNNRWSTKGVNIKIILTFNGHEYKLEWKKCRLLIQARYFNKTNANMELVILQNCQ